MEEWEDGHPLHGSGNSRSIKELGRAIESDPSRANYYFERAQVYMKKKKFQRSIEDFTRAVKLSRNNPSIRATALACRGSVYLRMKVYAAAISDCAKAIEIDPACVPGYFNRGSAYFMRQQFSLAVLDLTEAARLSPDLASAWELLGEAYLLQNNYDLAVENYERAIKLGVKEPNTRHNLELALQAKMQANSA
jgi:tetratricopeptide (TPR) repeat protein